MARRLQFRSLCSVDFSGYSINQCFQFTKKMLIKIEAGGPHGLRGVLLKQRSITRRTLNPCMQPGFTLVQGLQEGIGVVHWGDSSILKFFWKYLRTGPNAGR